MKLSSSMLGVLVILHTGNIRALRHTTASQSSFGFEWNNLWVIECLMLTWQLVEVWMYK